MIKLPTDLPRIPGTTPKLRDDVAAGSETAAPAPAPERKSGGWAATGAAPSRSGMIATTDPVELSPEEKKGMAKAKGTCPFIGSGMASGMLPVLNSKEKPLASIDDVKKLGNSGGGDLGQVLELFAQGNHSKTVGVSGELDTKVPPGTFSLDLPGSQGAHPGHSGILMGDPKSLGSGRFSDADWKRLLAHSKDGYIKRSEVGKFIAENIAKDPNSKVLATGVAGKLGVDALGVGKKLGPAVLEAFENKFRKNDKTDAQREKLVALTKLTGEDNLVGSAGEFGLLFAFLANKPGAKKIDGEPALSVKDLESMFKEKKFPEGWETWPKNSSDWVSSTSALTLSAGKEYLKLRHE